MIIDGKDYGNLSEKEIIFDIAYQNLVLPKYIIIEDKKSIGSNLFWSKIRGEYDLRVVE